jgi:hypothetical protein
MDPTELNRQGNDEGTQYRSAAFYKTDAEKKILESTIQKLQASGKYKKKIVTEVAPFTLSIQQDHITRSIFIIILIMAMWRRFLFPSLLSLRKISKAVSNIDSLCESSLSLRLRLKSSKRLNIFSAVKTPNEVADNISISTLSHTTDLF